jgi:hypothetical protein
MEFAETVAVNRGLPIAVFATVSEAREWLLRNAQAAPDAQRAAQGPADK